MERFRNWRKKSLVDKDKEETERLGTAIDIYPLQDGSRIEVHLRRAKIVSSGNFGSSDLGALTREMYLVQFPTGQQKFIGGNDIIHYYDADDKIVERRRGRDELENIALPTITEYDSGRLDKSVEMGRRIRRRT